MKKIISVLIIAVLLFSVCGTAFATTWSGGHDTGDSDLTIAPGDILDNSFGVHGVVSVSGGYNCSGWADWGVSWGSRHKSFYVETVGHGEMYSKPHLILSGYYISTDGYTDDECHYGDPEYSWTDDKCTATVTCTRNASHTVTETVTGTYYQDKAADCLNSEVGHYEAVFTKEYFTSSVSESVTVGDPLGHKWGEPEYTWEGDQCTKTLVCVNDETHVRTKTETGIYVIDTEADCENPETGHYAAFNGIESDSFTAGKALGHDWGEPEYTWEGDQCTETIVCGNDETHVQTKTETGKYVIDRKANCEQPEKGHYEAFDGAAVTETFVNGKALGHTFGAWKTVKEPTPDETGLQQRRCEECGECESKVLSRTQKTSYLSLDGGTIAQIMTEEENDKTGAKVLVIAPAEEEKLTETDLLTATFTAEDIKGFVNKGYAKVIIKSAFDTVEVVFAPDELAELLETAQCVKAEFLLSDRAEIDDKAEFGIPEGLTPNSGFHDVILIVYDKDGNEVEPDKEQLKNIKLRIYDAEPLTDVNNDIVGLYSKELPEFVEVAAEYFYEEEKEIGYWELSMQENGVYRTAEKLPAAN